MGKVLKRALHAPFCGTLMADANCATPNSSLPDLCMSPPPASSDSSCQHQAQLSLGPSMMVARLKHMRLHIISAYGHDMWE